MERRNSARIGAGIAIRIRLQDASLLDAHILNLSADGMFVKASSPKLALLLKARHDEQFILRFNRAGEGEACAIGAVVWHNDMGFGVEFDSINREYQIFAGRLIEANGISEE